MKRFLGLLTIAFAAVALATTASAANFTINDESGSVVYTDFGNGYNAVYLVFQISADANVPDVWAELDTSASSIISNVGSGVHQLKYKPGTGAHGSAPTPQTGLVTGQPKGVFFLVSANALTAVNQTLTVNLYDADPSGAANLLASQNFSFTVADTIQANANKVNTVVTIPDNPTPGQLGKITVTGCTGTVGAGMVLYFTPVSADDWPADAFEFVDSDIQIDNYANSPYRNVALIPSADVLTTNNCYDEIFSFEINGAGSGSTTPANFITSGGTNVKHTTNTSGSFDVVIPVTCQDGTPVLVSANPSGSQTIQEGDPITDVQFSASGGGAGTTTYTFSSPSNLHGLTLGSDGLLSGTPDAIGTFNIVVEATSTDGDPSGCQGTTNFSFTVQAPPAPVVVPTLSQWGMILLGLAVAGIGVKFLAARG
jgi:hypothetical protein